jgi:chromosome segregation ATPase
MGGKRQANTLSALISNFDTVEDVIETSSKSAGSALKENERYLDSIQGRIDQFNNSVQAMWSNTIDSDTVKGVVQLGTELIKIIDNLGLVKTLVMAIGTYFIQKNFKGNLFGGIFDAKSIDDAKMHLQSLKSEYEKAQKAYDANHTKTNKKYLDKTKSKYEKYDAKVSPQVKEYDEINKQLTQAQDNLADYQKKLDNYTGKGVKRRAKLQADVDKAQANVDELNGKLKNVELQVQKTGVVGATAGQKIVTGFKAGIKTVWSFGKQLIASFATMYAITAALEVFGKIGEGISYVWDEYIEGETAAEAKEKFEELNNELSETTSELNNLESKLDDANDRIEELLSQDSLTLVEQDELKKLQSSTSELERQIELTKELQKLQQTSVNTASLNAMDKYTAGTSFYSEKSKTEREEEAKETGNTIGNVAGLIIGGVIGSFIAPGAGTMVGAGIGSAILSPLLGAGFAAGESSSYGSEMTVEEALDRMAIDTKKFKDAEKAAHEAYAKSNSEEDKQRWIEASQALNDYQNNLATSISQIQSYINSIDYSALTDPKEKQAYLDALDDTLSYAITQGVQGAERLAIESIFSEKLITEDAQALMDAITSALKLGDDVDFMDFNDSKFDAIKDRLASVGLTVTDLIYHFADLKEKAEASLLIEPEDMIKPISELSSVIGELKSAFDEFNDSGIVTAETLMKLSETFGELDGWKGFVDLAGSGVATVEEMENSINILVEDLATKKIDNPFQLGYDDPTTDINEAAEAHKSYWMTITQLQELGITNAKELVDAMQQKAVAKAITNEIDVYDKLYEKQAAGEKLTEDEQKLLSDYATREDYKKHLIEEYKVKYGLNELSAENLALIDGQIDKQMELSEQSEKIAKLDKLKGESFNGNNSLLAKFQKSLESTDTEALNEFKDSLNPGEDVIEKYSKIREEYDALDEAVKAAESAGYNKDNPLLDTFLDWTSGEGWGNLSYDAFDDSLKEFFTLGLANTDLDNYDNLVNDRNEKLKELYGVSDEVIAEIQNRQDLFKQLTDIANEYEIDLSDIDLTSFDATDTGDNSVFKQVYDTVYKALYGENGNGGLMAEWKATEEQIKKDLGTAFDEIGLEVTLELQDKDKLIDDIQSVYDELLNAQKEYAENGHVSVDTMQSLLKLEPKYLDLLVDENGNLNLTKENLHAVARARITDLGLKQQNAIVDQALALATNGSMQALNEWIIVNETADESMKDSISTTKQLILAALKAREATGELPEGYADNFMGILENQLSAVQRVTDLALSDLDNTLSSSGNTATADVEDAFQKLMDYWDNRISANQAKYDQIQNDIDFLESQGKMADANYYRDQIALLTEGEESKEAFLEAKLQGAADRLRELEAAGKKGSDEWWEAAQIYNDTLSELDDVRDTVLDLQDAIGEIEWSKFEELNNRIDDVNSKLETMRDLIAPNGEEDWFDDEGNWTEKGVAVLGSYVQSLEYYKNGLNEATEALETFQSKEYNEDNADWFADNYGIHSEQEYYDYLQKLTDEQYKYASSVSDTEQDITGMWESQVDAVEEYFGTLIESYNDYIDSVKEALDAERDLYDFKKNVQKQSKDIAALERRIASLSGSTNASDIAERRKLESELYESRESLNDTYYDHSKQSQQEALEAESLAYEETMNRFVENLRTNLDTALENMDTFIQGVTSAVTVNAPTILGVYNSLGIALDSAIVDPWQSAIDAMGEDGYSGEEGLGLMNSWVAEGGVFSTFSAKATDYLISVWDDDNVDPGNAFATAVSNKVSGIVTNIQKNVETAKGYLQDLYDVQDTSVYAGGGGGGGGYVPEGSPQPAYSKDVENLQKILNKFFSTNITVNGIFDDATREAVKKMQEQIGVLNNGVYNKQTYEALMAYLNKQPVSSWFRQVGFGIPGPMPQYAKGTTGTPRDQWALTDEPQFGDELVLVPGKDGNLSFMRKGTGVVPADMTQKLMELAQIPTADLMHKNLTAVVPNITKNDFKNEFNFESLVHVDTVDSDTLPKLEKMVDKKIDDFSKALNYSLKRFAR